jgi:PLP dependent protein
MSEGRVAEIQKNYQQVIENIARAARSVGREPASVKLVVVTKGHPIDTVRAVVAAGADCLGENYIEDAFPKISGLEGEGVEWHMIGHVQSRKARQVSENFSWVHSVDSFKLARRLSNFSVNVGNSLSILLECNISREESKFGWPVWDETHWPKFVDDIAPLIDLPSLNVRGLMTMPPFDPDPEKSRPYFEKLVRLRDFLATQLPQISWSELSMGMSGDYEVAVQSGANIVRVGTAIVGPRPVTK